MESFNFRSFRVEPAELYIHGSVARYFNAIHPRSFNVTIAHFRIEQLVVTDCGTKYYLLNFLGI